MSLHIDPKALHTFATDAARHSAELKRVRVDMNLTPDILGKFDEASDLVAALKKHTTEVNQRLQATSEALWGLSKAAALAAELSHTSDDDITHQTKKINHQIDDARRKLGPHVA